MKSEAIVVFTTAPKPEEAENLARKIVEARLAACVQVLPPMVSIYFWENEVQKDAENLILIKTFAEKFDALKEFIQKNHSYDVPEIIAVPASGAAENYLDWMGNYLK